MRPAGLPSRASFANRPHGTRLRYASGCHCAPCRASNAHYERERKMARLRGEWNGIVDAAPAREHILKLAKAGVGFRSVADAASVARTVVAEIKSGQKHRVRAETARRILAVTPEAVADNANVPAGPTWRRIRALLKEGFTHKSLAARLGSKAKVPSIQYGRRLVKARSAMRVEKLCNLLGVSA